MLRDLLAGHDSDLRYNSPEARSKIASVYLPLLSVVMDNYQLLYKGADGWEDWTTTFERNTSGRRRSVVIRGDATDGSLEVEQVRAVFVSGMMCVGEGIVGWGVVYVVCVCVCVCTSVSV